MATDNYDRELSIGLASNEQQLLNDIDVALKRIEDGTYGICEIYGLPIPKKRLLAMPYTRLSMKAQEEEEKNKRFQ
jgi:RNA polymerase-binding transcription factor DksA